MIATALSSDSLSWLAWQFLTSLLAGLGGLLVLVGFWLEGNKEAESHSNIDAYRREHKRRSRGIRFVFWGVFLEVLLAFGISFKDGREIRNLRKEASLAKERFSKNEFAEMELERILFPISFTNQALSSSRLAAFSGTEAEIKFLPQDNCAMNSALALLSVLNDAKWKADEQISTNELFNGWALISINVPRTNADPVIFSNKCQAAIALQQELINSDNPAVFELFPFDPKKPLYQISILTPIKYGAGADAFKHSFFFQNMSNHPDYVWPPGSGKSSVNGWPTNWFRVSH